MEKTWRCQKYGPLMWMQIFIKLLAIFVGLSSLSTYDTRYENMLSNSRIAEIALLAIAGCLLTAMMVYRFIEKEIFLMTLHIAHVIAHWILVLIAALSKDPSSYIFTYVFLMILAEFTNIMYVFLSMRIGMKWFNKYVMYAISAVFIAIYIGVIIAQIVIWLIEYTP